MFDRIADGPGGVVLPREHPPKKVPHQKISQKIYRSIFKGALADEKKSDENATKIY